MEDYVKTSTLLGTIGHRETDVNDVAKEVIEEPKLLSEILDGLSSETARIRLGCAKVLSLTSRKQPVLLYPKIDFFVQLLDSDNSILKWNAVDIIANLTLVDSENIFNRHFGKYYSLVCDESMITAAHVVDNSGKIALAKPELTEKITDELLGVEEHTYQTTECRNILLGKVILAIDQYFDQIEDKDKVIPLVKRQLKNPRNATRAKAEEFLGKRGF